MAVHLDFYRAPEDLETTLSYSKMVLTSGNQQSGGAAVLARNQWGHYTRLSFTVDWIVRGPPYRLLQIDDQHIDRLTLLDLFVSLVLVTE